MEIIGANSSYAGSAGFVGAGQGPPGGSPSRVEEPHFSVGASSGVSLRNAGGGTKSVTGILAVAVFMNSVQIGSAASEPERPIVAGPSYPTQTTASNSGV
jgi:hypothetical protein